jgi:hypothetical protein
MTAYIKNKGIAQTFFQDNHHNKSKNEIKWNADYDGNNANIKVDLNDNGKKNKYRMQLNNQDLANLLSIPMVNKPLESRLKDDFLSDYDFLDEEDVALLNSPIPEPALFRLNIPQLNSTKETLNSPIQLPCPFTSNTMPESNILIPELSSNLSSSFSELSSLPDLTSLSSIQPETRLNPKLQQQQQEEFPVSENPLRPGSTKKLTKKEKNIRLNTPSPKTMRIHYTSVDDNKTKGRGTRSKKRTNKKENKFIKFFNKLF